MKRLWKTQDIEKALRQMAKANPPEGSFDRVWYKLEDRLGSRKVHSWRHIIWKPWGHPVRWVAVACLCLGLTGFFITEFQTPTTGMRHLLSCLFPILPPM